MTKVCVYICRDVYYTYVCMSHLCLCVYTKSERASCFSHLYLGKWVGNIVSSVERKLWKRI